MHIGSRSAVKLAASQAACRVANKAVQIHGGLGYMREYPVERLYGIKYQPFIATVPRCASCAEIHRRPTKLSATLKAASRVANAILGLHAWGLIQVT